MYLISSRPWFPARLQPNEVPRPIDGAKTLFLERLILGHRKMIDQNQDDGYFADGRSEKRFTLTLDVAHNPDPFKPLRASRMYRKSVM